MAILGGVARVGGKAVMEIGKAILKAAEKVGKASSDSSKESLSLKSVSKKFDPVRKAHEHGHGKPLDILKTGIKESVSFKSPLDGSLDVAKLAFKSHNSQKTGISLGNEVGKDTPNKGENFTKNQEELLKNAHNNVERFIKEGEELLKKIDNHRGKDKLIEDTYKDVKEPIEKGEKYLDDLVKDKDKVDFLKKKNISMEDIYIKIDKLKYKLEEINELNKYSYETENKPIKHDLGLKDIEKDIYKIEDIDKYERLAGEKNLLDKFVDVMEDVKLVKSLLEEFNDNVGKGKDNSAKAEYIDNTKSNNTKSSSDDARLDRAFEKARANLKQYSSEYGSEEEKFQARGTKIENYPYYDASRQKVVHENNHKHLNVEKSTLNHNQELKDKIAKGWDRLHSINNHLDSFNQQLRQIDPGEDVMEALMKAYGVRSPLPEDGNTQQNTNGTSDLGDKLKEKMGLAGNKKNQQEGQKTGGVKGGEKSIGSVSHLAAEQKTGGERLKGEGKGLERESHMVTEHKTGMNLAGSEIKETGFPRSFENAEDGVDLRKRMEKEAKEVMRVQNQGKEQQKTMRELQAIQEVTVIEHHKLDISERNRNMEKENIVEEESVNSKLHNNDIKGENEPEKIELPDKKNKKGKEEEQTYKYAEAKMEGNNDKVEKYSKEWNQQVLEASSLSQRSVNIEAKVASDLENSVSKVSDAIPDVSTTVPTVTNVPNVAAANMLYESGDNIRRPLKSSERPSQRSASVEQLKEEYIGLIEGKAENEFQKFMARKSAGDAYEAFVRVGGDPKKLVEDFKEAAKSTDFAAQVTSWLRQKEYTGFRDIHQVQQETSMAREIKVEG